MENTSILNAQKELNTLYQHFSQANANKLEFK